MARAEAGMPRCGLRRRCSQAGSTPGWSFRTGDLDDAVGVGIEPGGLQVEHAQRLFQLQRTEFEVHGVVSRSRRKEEQQSKEGILGWEDR
jgi:hypothetical protein